MGWPTSLGVQQYLQPSCESWTKSSPILCAVQTLQTRGRDRIKQQVNILTNDSEEQLNSKITVLAYPYSRQWSGCNNVFHWQACYRDHSQPENRRVAGTERKLGPWPASDKTYNDHQIQGEVSMEDSQQTRFSHQSLALLLLYVLPLSLCFMTPLLPSIAPCMHSTKKPLVTTKSIFRSQAITWGIARAHSYSGKWPLYLSLKLVCHQPSPKPSVGDLIPDNQYAHPLLTAHSCLPFRSIWPGGILTGYCPSLGPASYGL